MNDEQVMLGHGSGGSMMKRIIDEVFFDAYGSPELAEGNDAAVLQTSPQASSQVPFQASAQISVQPSTQPPAQVQADSGQNASQLPQLAFSTDSFVVTPHFFPGGDIGRLAVCGTVNDVATSGATPRWLSVGMILEEGFPMADLRRICESMREAADEAGVRIVTGDTKVVNRGHGDGIFINTSGIGELKPGLRLGGQFCQPGDKVLLTGTLGDHGITIMSCREGLNFQADIESDAAPLNHLIADVIAAASSISGDASASGESPSTSASANASATSSPAPNESTSAPTTTSPVRCFRDPTRGGIASTLNELAAQCGCDITIDEASVPVKPAVLGACEMLGYDVMQVANEGKMVCVVSPEAADAALAAMRSNKYGRDAAIIGEVGPAISADEKGRTPKVFLRTAFGSTRILDMLVGEQLPRIC